MGCDAGLGRTEIVLSPLAGAGEDAAVTTWRSAAFSLNGSLRRAPGHRAPLMPLSTDGPPRPCGVRPGRVAALITQRRPVDAATASGRAHPTGGSTPGPGTTSSIEEVGQ